MKRHNFKGGRASHGNSKAHRIPGSTGGRQDPGRTFLGKKMPGRMGSDRVTVQNLKILKVNILFLKFSSTSTYYVLFCRLNLCELKVLKFDDSGTS